MVETQPATDDGAAAVYHWRPGERRNCGDSQDQRRALHRKAFSSEGAAGGGGKNSGKGRRNLNRGGAETRMSWVIEKQMQNLPRRRRDAEGSAEKNGSPRGLTPISVDVLI